jgi:hypothetical protein
MFGRSRFRTRWRGFFYSSIGPSSANAILLEDDFFLLLETGDYILLEQ